MKSYTVNYDLLKTVVDAGKKTTFTAADGADLQSLIAAREGVTKDKIMVTASSSKDV